MKWVNTNSHRAYVDDPENESGRAQADGLLLIGKDETVSAEKDGPLAQRLDNTPGIVRSDTDRAKAHDPEGRDAMLAGPGPEAFPAETDEIEGPETSDTTMPDNASEEDRAQHEAIRGDSGGESQTGSYESRTVKELRALVKERNLDVPARARKADLIAALRE